MKAANLLKKSTAALAAAALITSGFAYTAHAGDDPKIIVGSKDFTESIVVAEIYVLALEDAGYQVEREMSLGNAVIREAILSGDVDIYPEYTGTSLVAVLGMDPIYDPDECYNTVKEEYAKQLNLDYLEPTSVNDSQGLAMTVERAEELGISTISDAWEQAPDLIFSCKAEFQESPSGYIPLKDTYGDAKWKDVAIMEHTLSFSAAKSGDVDIFSVYTTEGSLSGGDYIVLEDDQKAYAPYYLAPVARPEALEENPGAEDIINQVTKTFTTKKIIELNARIDLDNEDVEDVAEDYYNSIKDSIEKPDSE